MSNKDGIEKNWDNVVKQFGPWKVEIRNTTAKVKLAMEDGEYDRALHHATGYLEASLEHLHKLWFYTWVPKWALVGYLLFFV